MRAASPAAVLIRGSQEAPLRLEPSKVHQHCVIADQGRRVIARPEECKNRTWGNQSKQGVCADAEGFRYTFSLRTNGTTFSHKWSWTNGNECRRNRIWMSTVTGRGQQLQLLLSNPDGRERLTLNLNQRSHRDAFADIVIFCSEWGKKTTPFIYPPVTSDVIRKPDEDMRHHRLKHAQQRTAPRSTNPKKKQ